MAKSFTWEFNPKAEKSFEKLDSPIRKRIIRWLDTNVYGSENPRLFGGALEGKYENLWKYRVGKYRIIADIKDDVFKVLVIKAGKRGDVYR